MYQRIKRNYPLIPIQTNLPIQQRYTEMHLLICQQHMLYERFQVFGHDVKLLSPKKYVNEQITLLRKKSNSQAVKNKRIPLEKCLAQINIALESCQNMGV